MKIIVACIYQMPRGPTLDTVYIKGGFEACLVEYGSNVKLCKDLLARGFQVTDILPPDQEETIGYTFVWTRKADRVPDAPTVILPSD